MLEKTTTTKQKCYAGSFTFSTFSRFILHYCLELVLQKTTTTKQKCYAGSFTFSTSSRFILHYCLELVLQNVTSPNTYCQMLALMLGLFTVGFGMKESPAFYYGFLSLLFLVLNQDPLFHINHILI